MGTVCEVCGDIGFEHVMLSCSDCNGSSIHRYCLDKVLFDASNTDCWFCYECQQRHGEIPCSGSLDKVSIERQPDYAHFGSTENQSITKTSENQSITKTSGSARGDVVAGRNGKRKPFKKRLKSIKKLYSPEKNSPRDKSIVQPKDNCTNRKGRNTTSITCANVKALQSCETIGIEIEAAKSNNGENRQVNNENSVHTWNNVKPPNPVIVNCLGYKLGDIDLLKIRRGRKSKKTSQSVTAPLKGFVLMKKDAILGSKNVEPSCPTSGSGKVNERIGEKSNCMGSGADSFKPRDHDDLIDHPTPVGCKNTKVNAVEYNRASVGARQKNYQEAALLTNNKCQEHGDNSNATDELALEREDEEVRFEQDCRASTESQQRIIAANVTQPSSLQNDVVDKAMLYLSNNRMPSEHTEIGNKMEYQSEPSKLLDPAKFILADIATEEEISDDVQNFVKNNPRKRRKLILLYDDDDDENEEEKAVDMQPEHVGPRSLKYDGPMTKHIVNTEYDEEATVLTGNLSNQNRNNGRPAKKRRYIDATNDEEDEAVVGAANSDCAVNNVANFALNDDANLVSETVVANGHCLQSRTISKSESADLHIFSQPAVEIVWSGDLVKVKSHVSFKMDAHLSNRASQKVWELSKLLQPVLEVEKFPWLKVWPKRWKSSGPIDDCIGLFFFPHSFRPNEVSKGLVSEIIESDSALKVSVGIADLLIFPSTIFPEQNRLYQGKHYLWGAFKRRKDMSNKGVLDREQDSSACATEECKQQGQFLLEQDASTCASEEGEIQEEHPLNQQDLEQRKSSGEEINVMNERRANENLQTLVESNSEAQMEAMEVSMTESLTLFGCSLSYAKPDSPIVGSNCSMQEGITSSLELNAPSATEPSAKGDQGQSHSGSELPTTKMYRILVPQTPRARQLFQEMANEGALVFPVQEETLTADYTRTCNSAGVGPGLNPDYQHLLEHSQPFNFISTGLDEPPQPDAVASDACLELFPSGQQTVRAPGADTSSKEEVDLELGLAIPSRPSPVLHLQL